MQLPKEIFENLTGAEQVINEGNVFYIIEKVDFKNGTRVFIKGAEHYQRGLALPEVLFAMNQAKRIVAESIRMALKPEFFIGIVLTAMRPRKYRIKAIQAILDTYCSLCDKVVSPYILKPMFMIPTAREVRSVIHSFLTHLGISEYTSKKFASIFSHIIEYDNAYRFRVLDIMSETSREALFKSPIKELRGLTKIVMDRDSIGVAWKFKGLALVLSVALIFPSVRNAFKKTIAESNFELLQYDEIDRYWTAMRTDYKWWGLEADERSKYLLGKNIPVPSPREEFEHLMPKKT